MRPNGKTRVNVGAVASVNLTALVGLAEATRPGGTRAAIDRAPAASPIWPHCAPTLAQWQGYTSEDRRTGKGCSRPDVVR
jgi:hypothetical protein